MVQCCLWCWQALTAVVNWDKATKLVNLEGLWAAGFSDKLTQAIKDHSNQCLHETCVRVVRARCCLWCRWALTAAVDCLGVRKPATTDRLLTPPTAPPGSPVLSLCPTPEVCGATTVNTLTFKTENQVT
jgi:hypothetical protein